MTDRNNPSVEDILKRLQTVSAENDSARGIAMPRQDRVPDPGSPVMLEKTKSIDDKLPTRSETDAIIDKYSTKVRIQQDPKSATQSRRARSIGLSLCWD